MQNRLHSFSALHWNILGSNSDSKYKIIYKQYCTGYLSQKYQIDVTLCYILYFSCIFSLDCLLCTCLETFSRDDGLLKLLFYEIKCWFYSMSFKARHYRWKHGFFTSKKKSNCLFIMFIWWYYGHILKNIDEDEHFSGSHKCVRSTLPGALHETAKE